MVGRNSQTSEIEYSCVLQPNEHLHGCEIFYLRQVVQDKKLTDGTPITSARVVFLEPSMAHSEKRPLIDNGVLVFYEDSSTGEVEQVTA
jgi:hypothetical protein